MERSMNWVEKVLAQYAVENGGWRVATEVKLRGPRICAEKLAKVLLVAQRRHPMLRTKIVLSNKSNEISWQEDPSLRIPIRTVSGLDKEEIYERASKQPLTDGDGAFKVVIYSEKAHEEKDIDYITNMLFFCDHYACDGLSFTNLIHEILLGLSDLAMFENLPHLEEQAGIFSYGKEIMREAGALKSIIRLVKLGSNWASTYLSSGVVFPLSDEKVQRRDLASKSSHLFFKKTFRKDLSKDLVHRCREHKTTVTGAVGTVIADSMASLMQEKSNTNKVQKVTTLCAIDARRHYKNALERHHLSFHVTGTIPTPLWASGRSNVNEMWNNAKLYKDGIMTSFEQHEQQAILPLVGGILARTYNMSTIQGIDTFGQPNIYFTNWGKLPIDESYGDWNILEVNPGINSLCLPFPMLIGSCFNGSLQLTLTGPQPAFKEEDFKYFFDGMVQRLETLSK